MTWPIYSIYMCSYCTICTKSFGSSILCSTQSTEADEKCTRTYVSSCYRKAPSTRI